MKRSFWWTLVLVGLTGTARPASAQLDYRNLDEGRPVRVEDAFPVEAYAFEFVLPYSVERERGEGMVHAVVPELAYGLFPNLHVGLKAPIGLAEDLPGTRIGLGGLRAFAFYHISTEFGWLPAFAVRVDGQLPVGRFAASGTQVAFTGLATRAFGASRLHVNGSYRVGSEGRPGLIEALPLWWAGVAVDRTLYRQSLLLISDVHVEQSGSDEPVDVVLGAGIRWQWTPTAVLDVGASRGLRPGHGQEVAFTLGVSHVFSVRALMPGAR